VKHVPERGGRLRRVRREPPGDRLRRDQRRGHARRGPLVRRALRLVVGVHPGPRPGPRPPVRRHVPTALRPRRCSRTHRRYLGRWWGRRHLGRNAGGAAVTGR
jgi:hypothetical protein